MKVLDLQCQQLHVFEGWFASEADFLGQCERSLVECPVCGDASITKRLSAPRLNLGHDRAEQTQELLAVTDNDHAVQAAWLAAARRIVANTDDVGERFAEEARKIHYGESPQRNIRGQTSRAETTLLLEEGIAVMPLSLPESLKGRLQ